MFKLPNNISICEDCMHKTLDAVSQFDYNNLLNNPQLMNELNKNAGMPFMGFDMGAAGIPNTQRIKKKKEAESEVKPVFDIANIPSPHHIKETTTGTRRNAQPTAKNRPTPFISRRAARHSCARISARRSAKCSSPPKRWTSSPPPSTATKSVLCRPPSTPLAANDPDFPPPPPQVGTIFPLLGVTPREIL